ncbi:hypothetical protein BJ973_000369 [Actinoplanes tereljensis]|uniref:Transmembrane protein n=1 Tax=Paractinoplanes tereljensis TaxID=571912 RepID=A0A919NQN0_9ACTN|nr:hypothetical protein [Actinoplanes tereljensis]GIF23275.1 hypothetical protein Ate02nite_60050 [Actinoplanes tereljensis]
MSRSISREQFPAVHAAAAIALVATGLISLKLVGVVDWPWPAVLAPLWVTAALVELFIELLLILAFLALRRSPSH